RPPWTTPGITGYMPQCTAHSGGDLFWLCGFPVSGSSRSPHSFPTRRSSDLAERGRVALELLARFDLDDVRPHVRELADGGRARADRKSTRLNSSHQIISYAVFCLKKKIQDSHCTHHQLDIRVAGGWLPANTT